MSKKKRYVNRYDNAIARDVFSALTKEWRRKKQGQGIYVGLSVSQERLLDKFASDLIHSWFLFFTAMMQRGVSNERVINSMAHIIDNRPELIDPYYVVTLTQADLFDAFSQIKSEGFNFGGYSLKKLAGYWQYNSLKLIDSFSGDPRNIFKGIGSFSQAFKRIARPRGKTVFQGLGVKILALYAYYLHERQLIPFFPSALQTDIHVMRTLWATGIIKKTNWAKKHVATVNHPVQLTGKLAINVYFDFQINIAAWSERFMLKNGFSHLDMIPAIWFLGRNYCRKSFQNQARHKGTKYVETAELSKNQSLWPKNYKDPCGICPINKYCKWAIPSYPYWEHGLLVKLGRRVAYPG